MNYKVIGLMSGSSLDGLDVAAVQFQEQSGQWSFSVIQSSCIPYPTEMKMQLAQAVSLNALDYLLLHTSFGHYMGAQVHSFIEQYGLDFQIQLIASHGHTVFHMPSQRMTAQIGDGAAIAAVTGIATISDLRAMDIALGGQGAPIVPIGEKYLWPSYEMFLNIGGIANISMQMGTDYVAFDICAANRVLNMLIATAGMEYDDRGAMARKGKLSVELMARLNELSYYKNPYPKSLANDFGTDTVLPLIQSFNISLEDKLHTYVLHMAYQIATAAASLKLKSADPEKPVTLLVTGGGAHHDFLIEQLQIALKPSGITIDVPEEAIVNYKEAIVMAFIGLLRWRETNNVLASVTGAKRDSVGGAVWLG